MGSGVASPASGVTPPGAMGACVAGSPRGETESVLEEETESKAVIDADLRAEQMPKTPHTLTAFSPQSLPSSSETREGSRLKVRLARLKMEAEERARQTELDHQLQLKKLELEAQYRLRQLELDSQRRAPVVVTAPSTSDSSLQDALEISRYVPLVPVFKEDEVDSFFKLLVLSSCFKMAH